MESEISLMLIVLFFIISTGVYERARGDIGRGKWTCGAIAGRMRGRLVVYIYSCLYHQLIELVVHCEQLNEE